MKWKHAKLAPSAHEQTCGQSEKAVLSQQECAVTWQPQQRRVTSHRTEVYRILNKVSQAQGSVALKQWQVEKGKHGDVAGKGTTDIPVWQNSGNMDTPGLCRK